MSLTMQENTTSNFLKTASNYYFTPSQSIYSITQEAWVRLGARVIDLNLFSFIFVFFLLMLHTSYLQKVPKISMNILSLFIWVFVESILLSVGANTPGKWLLSITVRDANEKKLSFFSAIKRSLSVWFYGLAMGIAPLSIFTLISEHSDLTKRGATSWDKKGNFHTSCKKIGIFKGTIAITILIASIYGLFI